MSELFKVKEKKYNFRKVNNLVVSNIPTRRYGIDSISYLGPKIWDLVPDEIKKMLNSQLLKQKWILAKCPCMPCKTDISYIMIL